MESELFKRAREAWFRGEGVMGVGFGVSHDDMRDFGGPCAHTKCDICAGMEWNTRITGHNCWKNHYCQPELYRDVMKKRCATILKPEWLHLRRNYAIALGRHEELPGLKCLFVAASPEKLRNPGPKVGLQLWRKRMAPYQTTFCSPEEVGRYRLEDYDFIIMTMNGVTPILYTDTPIFLYCHDHHPPELIKRAEKWFNSGQSATILTPYPSIWNKYFRIPMHMKVIFTPFLADRFWSQGDTAFDKRKLDVMVVGVGGPVYPERTRIYEHLKNKKLPFSLKLWGAGAPAVGGAEKSAASYSAPPMLLWSRHLAKAKICVFGQDKFGYFVNKYSEIAGACSLMVAPTVPECELAGLLPGKHYVELQRPVEKTLIPQLTELTRNFDKYRPIALEGLKWFQTNSDRLLYDDFWAFIDRTVGAGK